MAIHLNTGNNSKKVYKSALKGTYFGIFNVFYMFIPYLTSLHENKFMFFFYIFAAILILASLILVVLFYRDEYNYNTLKLRYLLFTALYTLTFYGGLTFLLYKKFSVKFLSLDTYFLILYVIFAVMSSWDILSSTLRGFSKIKRLYTRAYKKQLIFNILTASGAVATGILLLLPEILI